MKKVKQFIKDHKTGLITLGGISLVTIIAIGLTKTSHTVAKVVTENNLPGYDIWAMVGTDCSPKLFEDVTKIIESYGKSIKFEILD